MMPLGNGRWSNRLADAKAPCVDEPSTAGADSAKPGLKAISAGPGQEPTPNVFAVIPVFNRLQLTLKAIDHLKAQNYSPIEIIVSDGGSTDGTQSVIRERHADVHLLESKRELWWGGAMAAGISYALERRGSDGDLVLMMNNDVEIDSDYVETLVRASLENKAAVGGLTVDSKDHSRVVDSGVVIDWERYLYRSTRPLEPGDCYFSEPSTLSGRATIVPIYMILAGGNVDARRFPHYLGDYEFFLRLKAAGFNLGVAYDATIRAHLDLTGIVAEPAAPLPMRQIFRLAFSRRSKSNIVDHMRLVRLHAPRQLRTPLLARLILAKTYHVSLTIPAVHRTLRTRFITRLRHRILYPYLITARECSRFNLDAERLLADRLIHATCYDGYFFFAPTDRIERCDDPLVHQLYRYANQPRRKWQRLLMVKSGLDRLYKGSKRPI